MQVSLTHQSIVIQNIAHPTGKKFPKLRGGTAESILKFLLKLYDYFNEGDEQETSNSEFNNTSYRLQQVKTSSNLKMIVKKEYFVDKPNNK